MYGKGRVGKTITWVLVIGCLVGILYAYADAIGINRILGSNVTVGTPLSIQSTDGKDSIWIAADAITISFFADEDWGDISIATNVATIDEDVIDKANFADEDWGDVTVATNNVTIDNGVVEAADLKAEDFGDFTVAAGVATLDAGVVADNEIDYSAVTFADFDYETAWRMWYSNVDGDVTELALGADGTYLKSNGAAAAPTWDTPGGSGDITDVYDCASGDCNQLTIGESEFLAGGAVDGTTDPYISLPQGADVSSVTGEGRISWDTDGDRLYVGSGTAALWILKEEDIDASSELAAIMDDETGSGALVFGTSPTFTTSVNLPSNAVDAAGEISADVIEESHLKVTGGAAVDEDIFTYESTTGDFEWHTPGELGLVSSDVIHDSLWLVDRWWDGWNPALRTGNPDGTIAVYHGMANDSCSYFMRHVHEATSDNDVDTLVWAGKLPFGIDANGIDSITYNIRTSAVADSTCIMVKVFKRDANELGSLTLCDSVAATATTGGAWEHKTTGALGVASADAGDMIEVWFICLFGTQQLGYLMDTAKPIAYYTGR